MAIDRPVIPAPIFIGVNSSRNPGLVPSGTGFPFSREWHRKELFKEVKY